MGKITGNSSSPDSIINQSGQYGSTSSNTSIWNQLGPYGNSFGSYSAFNDFASSPPQLYQGTESIGFVTTSTYRALRVHPMDLKSWLNDGNCSFA